MRSACSPRTREQSEGRRRAVSLNNLFLSSALASAAAGASPERVARELVLVDPEDGSDLLFELLTAPVKEIARSAPSSSRSSATSPTSDGPSFSSIRATGNCATPRARFEPSATASS